MQYNPVTKEILEELLGILGPLNVITHPEGLEAYSHDETDKSNYAHLPEVVVTPSKTEEVAAIVLLANRKLVPITPRGAGTGLSGGAIPVFGGIVLSLLKMNRIIEIDRANMVVVAEAGVITNEINEAVKEQGLFFAGYPMSLESCFLGGNIAENAGGGKAIKYGVTGRYVLGLELVTPKGDVVFLGGKLAKDVAGYDLKQLVIGSEGTLGIVTKAMIKLSPLPTARSALLVLFASAEEALALVPLIMTTGLTPTTLEFMDQLSVATACRYLKESLPYEDCGAMLLIEMDGTNKNQVEKDAEFLGELCMEHGAMEVYVADNRTTQERIWSVRRNIPEAFKVASPMQSTEDIVVPLSAIARILPELSRIAKKHGIQIPCFGHAGDGNLHATLVKDPASSLEEWYRAEYESLKEIYQVVTELGGKITGEHGIGLKRKGYLKDLMSPVEMELMKGIKKAWDPKGIMNPGKIFDL